MNARLSLTKGQRRAEKTRVDKLREQMGDVEVVGTEICPICGSFLKCLACNSRKAGRGNKGKTSDARKKASAENGRLGGRPPKGKAQPPQA